MMKMFGVVVATLVMGCAAAGLSGCKKEGPAERVGKAIDRSVAKADKEIVKAGEKMKEAIFQVTN